MTEATAALRTGAALARVPLVPLVIFGVLVAGALTTASQALDVWSTGSFIDTDDAMRLVQVRDLLAGQGWFDLVATRLDPPGTLMHWSRVVDIPVALLIKAFSLATDTVHAERLARLIYPQLLLVGLYAAVASAAGRLTDATGMAAAVFITFASAPFAEQFQPGRIDHHSADIVLLVCAAAAVMRALDPLYSLAAPIGAVAIAVSLGISIETLPLLAIIASALPIAFAIQGERHAPALARFALTLGGAALLVMFVTTAPSRWTAMVCDAASAPHYLAIEIAALGLFLVAAAARKLTNPAARFAAILAVALSVVAALALFYPGCLGDPFVAVDPLVRTEWLATVTEATPAWRFWARDPASVVAPGLPLLLALLAALNATITASARDRGQWLLLTMLLLAGAAMCVWQARYFGFLAPFTAISAAPFASRVGRFIATRIPSVRTPVWTFLFCLPFASSAYAALLARPATADAGRESARDSVTDATKGERACFRPETLRGLNQLPPALLLAPIDSGGYLLAETHHAVVAGAYHRNNRGNRLALEIFKGPIGEAEARLRSSGARYVVVCREQGEVVMAGKRAPDGLMAHLQRRDIPAWLRSVPLSGTVLDVYELAVAEAAPSPQVE